MAPIERLSKSVNQWRFAPSLISRSDTQLFGLPMPRFSARAYLDAKNQSFVNLRRARLFALNLPCWSQRRPGANHSPQIVAEPRADKRLKLRTQVALVGDCYLSVPEYVRFNCAEGKRSLATDFHVITTNLLAAYGEVASSNNLSTNKARGTGYIQYTELTGTCSQAACFIASVLLSDHAKGVYGLAEVTALAKDERGYSDEIPVVGLTCREIVNYFQSDFVQLNCSFQQVPRNRLKGQTAEQLFCQALKAYLISNMPVILPVDKERWEGRGGEADLCLPGPSIHEINDTGIRHRPMSVDSSTLQPSDHCVVLVGCHSAGIDEFVVHDPLSVPYLLAHSDKLVASSFYRTDLDSGDRNLSSLDKFIFQPVTPKEVKVPLQSWLNPALERKTDGFNLGLVELSLLFIAHYRYSAKRSLVIGGDLEVGLFRLLQLGVLKDVLPSLTSNPRLLNWAQEVINYLVETYDNCQWIWVQVFSESIWIWNAQSELPSLTEDEISSEKVESAGLQIMIGCFGRSLLDESLLIFHCPEPELEVCGAASSLEDEALSICACDQDDVSSGGALVEMGLITSFLHSGLLASLSGWPVGVKSAELYAFMQSDVRWLLTTIEKSLPLEFHRLGLINRGLGRPVLARDFLARIGDRGSESVYFLLAETLSRCFFEQGVSLRAFATFLPEITDPNPRTRKQTQLAIRCLVKLASQINKLKQNHDVRVIEIVAGSSTYGVWPARDLSTDQSMLVANRVTFSECLSFIDRELFDIQDCLEASAIRLAFEVEPGPLFCLNGFEAVKEFDRFVNTNGWGIGKYVGLNLDVAHWKLCGIDPSEVPKSIQDLVIHMHVSDHGKGHFGDASLGSVNPLKEFEPWLTMGGSLVSREGASGMISLELECCLDDGVLRESVKNLKSINPKIWKP